MNLARSLRSLRRLDAPICNNRPERAPRYGKLCFPLCWRCTAAAFAIIGGRLALPETLSAWIAWPALLLLLPAYIDGISQYEYGNESSNFRRIWTGFLLGAGMVLFWKWARALF